MMRLIYCCNRRRTYVQTKTSHSKEEMGEISNQNNAVSIRVQIIASVHLSRPHHYLSSSCFVRPKPTARPIPYRFDSFYLLKYFVSNHNIFQNAPPDSDLLRTIHDLAILSILSRRLWMIDFLLFSKSRQRRFAKRTSNQLLNVQRSTE